MTDLHPNRLGGLLLAASLAGAAELGPPQDVAFTATFDKTQQRYLELLPQPFGKQDEHHVLIALHGHGSDRQQFATDKRDECRAARDAAATRGMIFISPDYRAPTSWMGPAAEADLAQIIHDLRQRYRIGRICLMGASMGGSSALIFTGLHPDLVAGTVSLNGTANMLEYRNFAEAIAASYGGTRDSKPAEYRKRSPELTPGVFTRPIAFTTGGKDASVPPESAMRLAKALAKTNPNVLLVHRPVGGHATTYADSSQAIAFVLDLALAPDRDMR